MGSDMDVSNSSPPDPLEFLRGCKAPGMEDQKDDAPLW